MNTIAQTAGGLFAVAVLVLLVLLAVMWIVLPFIIHRKMNEIIRILKAIQLGVTTTVTPTPTQSDVVRCKCTHCSQHVSFSRSEFAPGQTITCPGCGQDTQLYLPPALVGMQR